MNKWLPLFPLKIVVFPGEKLNLHIFEPRYKQLIEECAKDGVHFGIPTHFENETLQFGTEMRLEEIVHRYPDGKLDIKTVGLKVFSIIEFKKSFKEKLYPAGKIEFIINKLDSDLSKSHHILEKVEELFFIMKIKKQIPVLDEHFNSFKIAHLVGFSLRQEYHLLTILSESDRLEFILNHLVNLIPVVVEMENLRIKAEMNGHFKELKPPDF